MNEVARQIAHRLDVSFSGHTRVVRYRDECEAHWVDIFSHQVDDGVYIGTIGGFQYPLLDSISASDGLPLRIELVTKVKEKYADTMSVILSSVYFEIQQNRMNLFPGAVIQGLNCQYDDKCLPHLYFTNPFFDGDWSSIRADGFAVAFLSAFPISESEYTFLISNGSDAFEKELEDSGFDYTDLHRRPLI